MTMNPTRPCPSCGGRMSRGTEAETLRLAGHSLTYQQPGWHCADCEDGILEGADNEAADIALRELKTMATGASPPYRCSIRKAALEDVQ
ncbi:hypothetical protein CHU95_00110 [Niveispirillum lacus]|uniref:YgiT-type zinc finger domain-containing protein n=1 Tax=Niveispirillum lacus TaxID=1981099 RepID=A0A255Z8T0_9PROT|nr:hypothetical protein CHU95_00110 [Niveispirillum lacus]